MKVIITGATGLVGEGVLLVALQDPRVTAVLSISRKPAGLVHEKLDELIIGDFSEIGRYGSRLQAYDACFFCAGASAVGENEESFTRKTYGLAVPFAEALSAIRPEMVFIYVSGNRTDSSEAGKVMWARVKGRTENALLKLPFRAVYAFRPGFMKPVKGQKNVRVIYRVFEALYPLWLRVLPGWACTMREVGMAMLNCVEKGYAKPVLEVGDIRERAKS
ncbi:MAG: NAD-dependent epimerase/dehydratase family protein [Mucilaginibacter polytrichastri]|nr:NAD-dependent epimerase/dehydratase family protein [Mucilaginibacter polytrichastri]